ncbi:MAG: 3-oxoacyl-ACP synthase [Fischerella sp. CENA71]|nr:3-oxoacyl-ACP synthase [Fischerella sp. CENA71]
MYSSVGLRSLAISLPSTLRTNDYYNKNYPELVATAQQQTLAKLFSFTESIPSNEFDIEMEPYLQDPFRGTIQQWILSSEESDLMLEYRAAQDALKAAKLSAEDIDLMIVASVWPEQIGFGNATFLARQLGVKGAAWNLDAASGVTPVALQTACALVRAGEYQNILVVISCTYSRLFAEDDTVSWFISDGAGAFVVGSLPKQQGILGTKTIHTGILSDILIPVLEADRYGNPSVCVRVNESASKLLRDTAADLLRTCCEGAVAAANLTLDQIDFFLFHTPMAWFASFCARILDIDPKRTLNLYPEYANIGPVITLVNLYHAAQLGKIRENDLVLVYGFGVGGVAAANVIRWSDIALAPISHQKSYSRVN